MNGYDKTASSNLSIQAKQMVAHWIFRVGDGNNFRNSSSFGIWGVASKKKNGVPDNKSFIEDAKPGDKLWFVIRGCVGKIIAVATFTSLEQRILGPLVSLTPTNVELGWIDADNYDIQVNYTDLYDLHDCDDLNSGIKGQRSVRLYSDSIICTINLPEEYPHIVRYRRPVSSL